MNDSHKSDNVLPTIVQKLHLNFVKLVYLILPGSVYQAFYVHQIGKDGSADRDGRLRRGDEIVDINGESMKEVSFTRFFPPFSKFTWNAIS